MRRIKAILDSHGIQWQMNGHKVIVLDISVKDGKETQIWRPCPENETALLKWLGY